MARRTARWLLLAVLLAGALPPSAEAHPAAPPPDHLVRILHDYNDDFNGHITDYDGHDLIALDLREVWDASAGENALVLRLVANGGWASGTPGAELRDVLSFSAEGAAKTVEWKTADNTAWNGTCGSYVKKPFQTEDGQADGTRFQVECTIRWSALGLAAGQALSGFRVDGYVGQAKADYMTGGYWLDGEDNPSPPPSELADAAAYTRSSFQLRGPTSYYTTEAEPYSLSVERGSSATSTLRVTSYVTVSQQVTVTASADGALEATLASSALALPGKTDRTVALTVGAGNDTVAGNVTITVTSDLGGRVVALLPVAVREPGEPEQAAGGTTATTATTSTSAPVTTVTAGAGRGRPTLTDSAPESGSTDEATAEETAPGPALAALAAFGGVAAWGGNRRRRRA